MTNLGRTLLLIRYLYIVRFNLRSLVTARLVVHFAQVPYLIVHFALKSPA